MATELRNFQNLLQEVTGMLRFLCSDKDFKTTNGFNMKTYFTKRFEIVRYLRSVANHLDVVFRDKGQTRYCIETRNTRPPVSNPIM
jgi:hypothetical protein